MDTSLNFCGMTSFLHSETGNKLCRSPQDVHLNHCFCNGWEFIKQDIAIYLVQSVNNIVIDSCWAIEHAIEELCPPV